ncbi:MAG TPA: hypothetical protein VGJ10_17930, partial [Paraburkholderia sp.]
MSITQICRGLFRSVLAVAVLGASAAAWSADPVAVAPAPAAGASTAAAVTAVTAGTAVPAGDDT